MQHRKQTDTPADPSERRATATHQQPQTVEEQNASDATAQIPLPIRNGEAHGNEFVPRPSHFDPSASGSLLQQSEFRGFFNLALIAGFFFVFASNTRHFLVEGTLLGLQSLTKLIPLDIIPIWLALVGFSFSVVVIQKLKLLNSPFFPHWLANIVWVFAEGSLVVGTILFLLWRKYPPVPGFCFIAEMLILFMKMHSYYMTNRKFGLMQSDSAKNRDKAKSSPPAERRAPNGNATTEQKPHLRADKDLSDSAYKPFEDAEVKFPDNVTFANYLYFLAAPTLVYELNYPRTPKIRWKYVAEKCITAVGTFSVLHVLVERYIVPVLSQAHQLSPVEAVASLIIPFVFAYVLVFYIMFDLISNGFAEVTRFADRQFYSDWWNSTSWDEFARKWNKPVHEWLLRHVYLESLRSLHGRKARFSRFSATFITFLISSIVHEMIIVVVLRIMRPWLFIMQMAQVPLIYLCAYLKGTRAGNLFFWTGMVLGPPMLAILYCREYVILSLSEAELQNIRTEELLYA